MLNAEIDNHSTCIVNMFIYLLNRTRKCLVLARLSVKYMTIIAEADRSFVLQTRFTETKNASSEYGFLFLRLNTVFLKQIHWYNAPRENGEMTSHIIVTF